MNVKVEAYQLSREGLVDIVSNVTNTDYGITIGGGNVALTYTPNGGGDISLINDGDYVVVKDGKIVGSIPGDAVQDTTEEEPKVSVETGQCQLGPFRFVSMRWTGGNTDEVLDFLEEHNANPFRTHYEGQPLIRWVDIRHGLTTLQVGEYAVLTDCGSFALSPVQFEDFVDGNILTYFYTGSQGVDSRIVVDKLSDQWYVYWVGHDSRKVLKKHLGSTDACHLIPGDTVVFPMRGGFVFGRRTL